MDEGAESGRQQFEPTVYDVDPTKAINSWKEAWEAAKQRADVTIRFHDLRHTVVTRMLEAGVPLSVVATILGWSPATTVRMFKRYGHIGAIAQSQAVEMLNVKPKKRPKSKSKRGGHKNGHSEAIEPRRTAVNN